MIRLKDRVNKSNNSGQALLEYTLLLLIILGVLAGAIYQFNTAFKNYAQAYFVGEESYLACLVKYGLLPGGELTEETCPKPKFDLSKGKTLNGEAAISAQDGSGKKPNANSAKGNTGSVSGNIPGRAGEISSGLIPANVGGKRAGAVGAGGQNVAKPGSAAVSTGSDGYSTATGGGDPWSESSKAKNTSSSRRRRTSTEEIDLGEKRASTTIPATEKDIIAARDPAFEKSKKTLKSSATEETFFSFGNIFKYLIIALLAFSILFFLGSQFVAVSKSRRKK